MSVATSGLVKISKIQYDITCVQPADENDNKENDFKILFDWCNSNRDYLRSIIYKKGGLLLRGWNINTVKVAEELIFYVLNFPTMELYPKWFIDFNERASRLGVPAAGLVQTKLSRNVPVAAKKSMQCPHVEFGAGPSRPRAVGFYCEIVAKSGGETGRFYFPDAVDLLPPELKQKLKSNGWWNPIAKKIVQPSILIHPETGMETLQLYAYSHRIIPNALKAYKKVREERSELPEVIEISYGGKDDYPLILVNEDGKKFNLSDKEMEEIFRAMFTTTEVFDWQKNDLLLFDNVLYGHFRLPGEQPRKLHAVFADEIDSRKLLPPNAPKIVQKNVSKPCPGAVTATLSQLGIGGKKQVIESLKFVPDTIFKLMGKKIWASGKGYNI